MTKFFIKIFFIVIGLSIVFLIGFCLRGYIYSENEPEPEPIPPTEQEFKEEFKEKYRPDNPGGDK